MGQKCFVNNCKYFKYKKDQSSRKLPPCFKFPKPGPIYDQWRRVVPLRAKRPRDPTERDCLCALHFKSDDIEKYIELPVGERHSELVRIDLGRWTLKNDAVPCYFQDDNPDENLLLRDVWQRQRNSKVAEETKRDVKVPSSTNQTSSTKCEIDNGKTNPLSETKTETFSEAVVCSNQCQLDSDSADASVSGPSTNYYKEINSIVHDEGRPDSDQYSIDQLHQDVLDIVLPKNWTFFQNDDEFLTVFMLSDCSGSVKKSVRFPGTCKAFVTINSRVMEHKMITSKQEIEDLLLLVEVW